MKHDHPVVAAIVLCWFLAINGVAGETSHLEPNVTTASGAAELAGQSPLFWIGATAMWSLARNGPAHPLVEVTLESRQDKTDDQRTREIIGDVLTENLERIREKLLARSRELKSADPTRVGHPWSLHDRSGFVGPAAGQPPPKSIWVNR